MLTELELQDIALRIREAQIEVRQIEPITSRIPEFDLPSAYAVAQLLHDACVSEGAVPLGRKIGFTNSDMWAIYGVREPIWAYVYDQIVTVLSKQPKSLPLQANEIVTTGTITTAQTIRAGESWQTKLQGIALADLALEFVS